MRHSYDSLMIISLNTTCGANVCNRSVTFVTYRKVNWAVTIVTLLGVVLIAVGEMLLARSELLSEQLSVTLTELNSAKAQPSGDFRVSIPPFFENDIIIPALKQLSLEFPKLRLEVVIAETLYHVKLSPILRHIKTYCLMYFSSLLAPSSISIISIKSFLVLGVLLPTMLVKAIIIFTLIRRKPTRVTPLSQLSHCAKLGSFPLRFCL